VVNQVVSGTRDGHSVRVGVLGADRHEPPSGTFEVLQEDGGPVLHLRGDVDAPLVSQIGSTPLDELVAVHVRQVGYIDSTGITLLVRWAQAAGRAGRPAVIRHASPRFRQVLELTGLTPLFVLE
jgi:anti-sigma B factor antagonist